MNRGFCWIWEGIPNKARPICAILAHLQNFPSQALTEKQRKGRYFLWACVLVVWNDASHIKKTREKVLAYMFSDPLCFCSLRSVDLFFVPQTRMHRGLTLCTNLERAGLLSVLWAVATLVAKPARDCCKCAGHQSLISWHEFELSETSPASYLMSSTSSQASSCVFHVFNCFNRATEGRHLLAWFVLLW